MNYSSFIVLFLTFCSATLFAQKKISIYELDQIKGLYFVPNTVAPYSGTATAEHASGKKKMEIEIKDGKIHGKAKEWEKNGEKIFESHYQYGIQVGQETQWYATGDKKLEINYIDGKANGVCKEWYKNGQLKSEGSYTNGKEDGLHQWWYSTGEKDQVVPFNNGLTNGIVKNWHKNGVLSLESTYVNGEKHGTSKEWYESGQLKSSIEYKNDVMDGASKYFNKLGVIVGKQIHNNGKLIKDENFRSGSIRTKEGYIQVFNHKESFYNIHLKGKKISPKRSDVVTYNIDGNLIQIYTHSVDDVELSGNSKDLLKAFQEKEKSFIEEKLKTSIDVKTEQLTNRNGLKYVYWYFKSPVSKDANPNEKSVSEEHYASVVCNKKILSLYSVVIDGVNSSTIKNALQKHMDNLEINTERIELNAFVKKLQ